MTNEWGQANEAGSCTLHSLVPIRLAVFGERLETQDVVTYHR
jgi:hypothetical protein